MQTLAEARAMLTETGGGGGVWEEVTAEKEKWGSGLRKGEANGEGESGKTDGPEGAERKVLSGVACGGVGSRHVRSGTDTEICSSSLMTSGVRHTGTELACKHGLGKGGAEMVSSKRCGCVTKT